MKGGDKRNENLIVFYFNTLNTARNFLAQTKIDLIFIINMKTVKNAT